MFTLQDSQYIKLKVHYEFKLNLIAGILIDRSYIDRSYVAHKSYGGIFSEDQTTGLKEFREMKIRDSEGQSILLNQTIFKIH